MMKSYLYPCIFLLAFSLCASSAVAQVHVGLNAFHFKPQGDLNDSGYNDGWGAAFELSSRDLMPNFFLNLRWGLHTDYAWNGSKSIPLEVNLPALTQTNLAITNQSVGAHLFGRVISKGDKMRWYMDYFFGSRYFFTTETFFIHDLRSSDYDNYDTKVSLAQSSATAYRGWSVGVEYRLTPGIFLDMRMTKAKGSRASFADLETVELNGNQVYYDIHQSHDTHSMAWHIGLTFQLGKDRTQKNTHKTQPQSQPQPAPQNDGALNKGPLPKS